MQTYKLTQSLIGAWSRAFTCRDEMREELYQEFLDALDRIKKPDNETQAKGHAFENAVQALAKDEGFSDIPKGMEEGAQKIADIVKGGVFQVYANRDLEINGERYRLEGICDVLKAGTIYDIKYKCKSFGSIDLAGAWLDSVQHSAYFYLFPDAYKFEYLASDGVDLYTERYLPRECTPFKDIAAEFIGSLIALGLFEKYKNNWRISK